MRITRMRFWENSQSDQLTPPSLRLFWPIDSFAKVEASGTCLGVAKMSLRTLPILFLNLGGEMLYILDQRLRAQSIPDEKARKGRFSASVGFLIMATQRT